MPIRKIQNPSVKSLDYSGASEGGGSTWQLSVVLESVTKGPKTRY